MTSRRDPLLELPDEERVLFLKKAKSSWPHLLLSGWAQTVDECRAVYLYSLEEYCNDLDRRWLIKSSLERARPGMLPTAEAIVQELDEEFRRLTIAVDRPLWNESVANTDPVGHFFYFRLPHLPGKELRDGLRAQGYEEQLNQVLRAARGDSEGPASAG